MVINHIEDHGETLLMACVHEPLQAQQPPIGILNGKGIDTIVAPVATSRKLAHGHEFNGRDAEIPESIQVWDHGIECSFRGVGSHMDLVDDGVPKGKPEPTMVRPAETRIEDLRGAMDPLGLRSRCGIRTLLMSIQSV
jgi:hypothetical protein